MVKINIYYNDVETLHNVIEKVIDRNSFIKPNRGIRLLTFSADSNFLDDVISTPMY